MSAPDPLRAAVASAIDREGAIQDAAMPSDISTDTDGNVLVKTYQDVEPHLEYAAKLRRADAENRGRFGKRRDLHHTMSVPQNVILAVAAQLGIPAGNIFGTEESKRIGAELKRSEFARFRTTIDKLI